MARRKSAYREIIDMVNDEDDQLLSSGSKAYRSTAFNNVESNNGWYQCVRCKRNFRKGDIEIDHIIPQSMGGDNSRYNLQCMCRSCNASKGNNMADTESDLLRRRRELKKQDNEDENFLKSIFK